MRYVAKAESWAVISFLIVMPTLANTMPACGQQQAADVETLASTIRRLEERVKALEAELNARPEPAPASDNLAQPDLKAESGRRQELKSDDDRSNGFMGFFQRTEVSGFVDIYYGYNLNRPAGDAQLRNFDTKHNQFGFNLAELTLEKKPTDDSRVGFRLDLNFGPATETVHSSEPGGGEVFKHLQQSYISYLAPVGKGLQIDVGEFVTPHGAEVIESKDNWNYSRSLLFALAIPYYHFGVRATYPVSDKVSLAGFLVNGWNNVVDNNGRKTLGLQAIIQPWSKLTIIQNYMAGPEQTGNAPDWRQLWDTTLTYAVNDSLSLMGNYDYGFDRLDGARVRWQGFAAYARFQANEWLAFAPRVELYDDHDGFTTGRRQTLKDFTLTSEQKVSGKLVTRLEYRRDFSDKEFFLKGADRLVKAQSTFAFGLIYAFSSKAER